MRLSKLLYLLGFILIPFIGLAQDPTEQDCLGAIPVCQDAYYQDEAYSGVGNFADEINPLGPTCMIGGEANSVWYTFTVVNDGFMSFILTPDDLDDDYDWGLYNITNATCEDIFDDASLEVSCNSYGVLGVNGATGISTAEGGFGDSNGPGDLNGPPFNADIAVTAGEVFVLLVQDWSGTDDGYTIDFSESTANIYDEESPQIIQAELNCDQTLYVSFSEPVLCDNLSVLDFQLIAADGEVYIPSDLESVCDESSYTIFISLIFDDPITSLTGDDFTLNVLESDDNIEDACGNVVELFDFVFPTNEIMEFEPTSSPAECNEENGAIDFGDITNGTGPFEYDLNGDSQNNGVFENLPSGNYTLTITDDNDCVVSVELEVLEISLVEIDAGMDNYSCDLSFSLEGFMSESYPVTWSGSAGIDFTDSNSIDTEVFANEPGTYDLIFSLDQDGCIITDQIEITFSDVDFSFALIDNECGDNCTGSAEIDIEGGVEPYSTLWSGIADSDGEMNVQNLCAGDYSIEVIDDNGCSLTSNFEITQPIQPSITSVDITDESCQGFCDGQITVNANNAVNYTITSLLELNGDPVFNGLCQGIYDIIISSENGCLFEQTVSVGSHNPPITEFDISPNSTSIDNPLFFIENETEGVNNLQWVIAGIEMTEFDNIDDFEYLFDSPLPGYYSVTLITTDEEGCSHADTQIIEIVSSFYVYIPNSFTPDGDGINDVFGVVINGHEENKYEIKIFNRWGEVVFHSEDSSDVWLGEVEDGKNYYSDSEVYVYELKVKPMFEVEDKVYNGRITLIR